METASQRLSAGVDSASAKHDGALPLDIVARRAAGKVPAPGATPHLLRRLHRARLLPAALALVMLGGLVGIYFQPPGLRLAMSLLGIEAGGGTKNPIAVPVMRRDTAAAPDAMAALRQPKTVAGLGRLLPASNIITIAPPFGSGDARVAQFKVKEGDRVQQAELLAVLDNERTLKAAADAAQATVAAREATLRQIRETVIASRGEARASLARAEAVAVNAKRELERVTELRAKGFATDASYDQKRAAHIQAEQDVERAKATLSRYLSVGEGSQADVEVALRNLDAAKADLVRTLADVEKAYVRAPVSGTVLTIHLRPGEKPGSQGIMSLGDLDTMMAELEVYQTQVGAVTVGSEVTLSADALPQPLKGIVSRVGLEVGKQSLTDATPAANTDARVVKVYVALDASSTSIARRFSNLQVTARIATGAQP